MKRFNILQHAATGMAGLGLILPPAAQASGETPVPAVVRPVETPAALDVTLLEGGMLVGQVVDAQGQPLGSTQVSVQFAGREVASAWTNDQGYFVVNGLNGGSYLVSAGSGSGVYRLWTANAAPPAANKGVLIVAGQQITRGQFFQGPNRAGALLMLGLLGGIVTAGLISQDSHWNSGLGSSS